MTRSDIDSLLHRLEERVEEAPWMQRLLHFSEVVTHDRVLQLSVALVIASLWFTLAFGDLRFLVLAPAAVVAVRRFRRLERELAPDDEDDWF